MKHCFIISAILVCICTPFFAFGSEENAMSDLSPRQQAFIPIAAFTADGNLDRLRPALIEGLQNGLTVNEIKEALVQLYAYVGFPRSLNALATFMKVVKERKEQGKEDVVGKEASPLPTGYDADAYGAKIRAQLSGRKEDASGAAWQEFTPIIDTFLKEHLFGDIFVRDVLSHQDRELVTISALANLSGAAGQLFFHFGAAMNTSNSRYAFNYAMFRDFTKSISQTFRITC
ncbi:MAG: carboxymuconolactone decarboxylase family protein [Desulfopila sp.]